MKNSSLLSISIVLIMLLFTSINAQATLISTFDSDHEGWWATSGARDGKWNSSGGNPGGYVSAEEAKLNDTWYFGTNKWAGDWTSYIGGTVSFDLIDIEKDEWDEAFGGKHGDYFDGRYEIVIIMDDDNRARWNGDVRPPLLGDWTNFQVSLLESTVNLADTSTETFETIMSNVSRFLIRGEYYGLDDKTGLDNVMVKAVPEPATLALMGLGLAGIGYRRRKAA